MLRKYVHLALFRQFRIAVTLLALICFDSNVLQAQGNETKQLTEGDITQLAEAKRLSDSATELILQGKEAKGEATLRLAFLIYEKVLGPDHSDMNQLRLTSAAAYLVHSKYAPALLLRLQALESAERIHGAEHPETADRLNDVAHVYFKLGDVSKAQKFSERALKVLDKTLGSGHADSIRAMNILAVKYSSHEHLAKAEELYERTLKISEKALGPQNIWTIRTSNNLAWTYQQLRKYRKAEKIFRHVLQIEEDLYGPESSKLVGALGNLEDFYKAQGKYAQALLFEERIFRNYEKALGREDAATFTSMGYLAASYQFLGKSAQAKPLLEWLVEFRQRKFGPHDHLMVAMSRLAGIYQDDGQYAKAERLHQQALGMAKTLYGPDHPETATPLNNLGCFYFERGEEKQALALLSTSLALIEKSYGAESPEIATTLGNLGGLHAKQGNFDQAIQLYERELKLLENGKGAEHPNTIRCLDNLATTLARQLRIQESFEMFHRARKASSKYVGKQLPFFPVREQSKFLEFQFAVGRERALSFAAQHGSKSERIRQVSATWLLNGKGVGQKAMAQRNLLTRDIKDSSKLSIVEQLVSVRNRLSHHVMAAYPPSEAKQHDEEIRKLNADEQRLSQALAAADAGSESKTVDWIELEQVRSALGDKSVLIDIARFDFYDFPEKVESLSRQRPCYAAWITHGIGGRGAILVNLGNANEIDALVETVRESIQNTVTQVLSDGEKIASDRLKEHLQALGERIWRPIVSQLDNVDEIIISPDAALWLAPWNSLPVDDDGEKFLIEQYAIRLILSGRELVRKPGEFTVDRPVTFANPHFDQHAKEKRSSIEAIFKKQVRPEKAATQNISVTSLLPRVNALPNTGLEAVAIQPGLERLTGKTAILHEKRYALESVAKALRRPQIASFATHGFFLPKQDTKAVGRERLDINGKRAMAIAEIGKPVENPLLRCGLLFAGCNHRDSVVGNDDGILTGLEIVGIDFRGTQLVVLSACDTGIGQVNNGEGVAGLRQAFQLAGAESVISSLWQVEDGETARLMKLFFDNLAKGMTKSEALRQAQLTRIAARRERHGAAHPFFWAAFTLTGGN